MILGLVGYAGSGKDAVGKLLQKKHGAVRYAFADRLKQEVSVAVGISVEQLEIDKDRYYRELLQSWGVMRRNVNGWDYWVEPLMSAIAGESPDIAVITDTRFTNEIEAIRRVGGLIIRIDRLNVGPRNAHISEHDWTSVEPDFVISNHGGLEELSHSVDVLCDFAKPFADTQRGGRWTNGSYLR